jgi:hypothetical protein
VAAHAQGGSTFPAEEKTTVRKLIVLAPAAMVLAAAATAAGQSNVGIGPATSFHAAFGPARPHASAGYSVRVTGAPPPPGVTEAPALRQQIVFPAGTRFDTAAIARCHATASQLADQAAESLCSSASRIGTGAAEGLLNGQTVHFDLVVFNRPRGLIFAGERDGKPLKQSFLGAYSGRRLTLEVPTANGAIAPTLFSARIRAHARRGHRYLTTPATCPRSHRWTVLTTFQGIDAIPDGSPVGDAQRRRTTITCRA